MCTSYSGCSLCVCFLKLGSHYFSFLLGDFSELSSTQSSLREALTTRRLRFLFTQKPCWNRGTSGDKLSEGGLQSKKFQSLPPPRAMQSFQGHRVLDQTTHLPSVTIRS